MAESNYVFAVARIRSKETMLFSDQIIEQLLACRSYKEAMCFVLDRGWGSRSAEEEIDTETLIEQENQKNWDLLVELAPDGNEKFYFTQIWDFHNLKVAIKEVYSKKLIRKGYFPNGSVPIEVIKNAVEEKEFDKLPSFLREAGKIAYEMLFQTHDPQICDLIVDRASLEYGIDQAQELKNEILQLHGKRRMLFAMINLSIRGVQTERSESFYDFGIGDCMYFPKTELKKAAMDSLERVYHFWEELGYGQEMELAKVDFIRFVRKWENEMIRNIHPQKYNPFTISPLLAYYLARENEIRTVKLILHSKQNNRDESEIRERLRIMYV